MDKNQPKHERIKIVLFGDSGAGKTSIMHKLTAGPIPKTHMTTIGVEFKTVNVDIEGKIVQLMIWDTAGQERFRTITSTYYRYTPPLSIIFGHGWRILSKMPRGTYLKY
ncbi:GTP-binding protein yptV2 [Thelohanellus kitauei]|uniref:GTP-binding protein yptV2 n=1 Tax=Thelohanellus kitauei TaxID=669202 RepID=A0A0C2MYT3_THEKT|nr:GTP-binding protein yptV2 [Thelohanellus kitauei]